MTTTEALALTAKPISNELAQNFLGTMLSHIKEGNGATLSEAVLDWCETHKERLTKFHAEPCSGCEGRGEVGGFECGGAPGYVTEPCPFCSTHNPAGLTPEQVGVAEGWRLLNKSEVIRRMPILDEIEQFDAEGKNEWSTGWRGSNFENTYRTKLTPAELAARRGLKDANP